MTLRGGRYRGRRLDEVPRPYLLWLARRAQISPELRVAVRWHLGLIPAPAGFDFKMAEAGDA